MTRKVTPDERTPCRRPAIPTWWSAEWLLSRIPRQSRRCSPGSRSMPRLSNDSRERSLAGGGRNLVRLCGFRPFKLDEMKPCSRPRAVPHGDRGAAGSATGSAHCLAAATPAGHRVRGSLREEPALRRRRRHRCGPSSSSREIPPKRCHSCRQVGSIHEECGATKAPS